MGLSVHLKKVTTGFTLDVTWEMGNEVLVLFGHSGAGKSMTLQLIAGLIKPDEGFVYSNDKIFFDSRTGTDMAPQERSFGYVFQDRVLFPHMTVRGNISYGLRGGSKVRRAEKVREMISLFHLEELENKYPSEISGGEKQRVTLARALIGRPDVLLLDEPFSALDNVLRTEMRRLLEDIRLRFDIPIVLVTHDLLEAYTMADKVALYSGGRVVEVGKATDIFGGSSNPDVDLFLALNFPLLLAQNR